jgi:type VI secretion system secreted protein VgrG
MAIFSQSIDYILKSEGGFVNDPDDPGGATNMGVTLKSAIAHSNKFGKPNIRTVEQLKAMTVQEASLIYEMGWWRFGGISDRRLATKLLDISINMDAPMYANRYSAAVEMLQCVLALRGEKLDIDGLIGPKTLQAANSYSADDLIIGLSYALAGDYRRIAQNRPASRKFLKGWLSRAKKVPA